MHKITSLLCVLTAFAALDVCRVMASSAGALDSTFNAGRIVTSSIGDNNYNIPIDFVIDEQNRIISLSRIREDNRPKFLFIRYLLSGEVDTSFGTNGRVVRDPGLVLGGSDRGVPSAIARQGDGKLLVAGYWEAFPGGLILIRFNQDGSLDSSFGTSGIAQGGPGYGTSIAIQTDGKIVVGGYYFNFQQSNEHDFLAVRFNTNGSLDTTFDGDGRAEFPINPGSGSDTVSRIFVQPGGKILMLGNAANRQVAARLLSNGTIDSTFGASGVRVLPLYASSTTDQLYDAEIDSEDGILLVGSTRPGGQTLSLLRRLTKSGDIDISFGTDERV